MAPLNTGRYIITNSRFRNIVYLADANSYSDLCADWQQNRPGERWNIVLLGNGNHTIENYNYSTYASCEFIAKPDMGNSIVGGDHPQQWKITEGDGNSYVICPTKNGQVYWHLTDGESGTPITLERYSETNKIHWVFSKVEDAEGSGAVSGGGTGKVHGNGPALDHVQTPTPVQVTTPVQAPTPVRVPVRLYGPVEAPSPGKYYAIGIAGGINQYLAKDSAASNTVYFAVPEQGVPRWLLTKHGDNWQIDQNGNYLCIPKYGEGQVSKNPTQFSVTPGCRPNEFRITDMASGQYFDGLEFVAIQRRHANGT